MPIILLERIPLPSLRTYTAISVGLLSFSVYYAAQVSSDPNWKVNSTSRIEDNVFDIQNNNSEEHILDSPLSKPHNASVVYQLQEVIRFMVQEPLCIWVSVISAQILVKLSFNSLLICDK